MPPVTKAGGTQFRKDVAFAETKDDDEYELVATGIVMVPDVADLQNDFAREDTIRAFAEQFETFAEAGQASGGIMHAVWPDGWMVLEDNEVLDEATEIGGQTVDAGAWIQRWGIANAELAALIEDDILEGYSIGAIQIDWGGPYEPDEVDDVDTSEIPDGEMVWELTDGIIQEVSAVDIPAVPDAQILEVKSKSDAVKRLAEHVGNQNAFIEEAMERGHSENEAQRFWDVLNEAVEADGSAKPGKESVFERAGRVFLSALTGSDNNTDTGTDDDAVGNTTSEDPGRGAAKEGRTLSTQNRESLFATIDAALDILHDASEAPEDMQRFTDREDTDFDLSEHDAREWGGDQDDAEDMGDLLSGLDKDGSEFKADVFRVTAPEDDADDYEDDILGIGVDFPKSDVYVDWRNEVFPDELDDPHVSVYGSIADLEQATGNDTEQLDTLDASAAKTVFDAIPDNLQVTPNHAPAGETADSTDMSNDNTEKSDSPPKWAESLTEKVEQIEKQVNEIDGDGSAEVTADGDAEKAGEEMPEWAEDLTEKVDDLDDRVETISKQSGYSQQADPAEAEKGGRENGEDAVKNYKKGLIPTRGD